MPGYAWPRPTKITSSFCSLCTCMQKINYIPPIIVVEISKLKNPAIWLAESIFAFNHSHPKLHDQFEALINMKMHAQNQLYTSISFWDIKVLKASLVMPGIPENTHLNLHNLFVTFIDMKMHAQNTLYTSFSFWDLKVLITSLGMPGHAWPRPPNITSSICSFNRYVPVQKINYIPPIFFEILKFKNSATRLAKSIFAFNWRTRFPDMRFQKNHKGHYGAWFKPKKSTH